MASEDNPSILKIGEHNISDVFWYLEFDDLVSMYLAFESPELRRMCSKNLEWYKRWKFYFDSKTSYFLRAPMETRLERFVVISDLACELRVQMVKIKVNPDFFEPDACTRSWSQRMGHRLGAGIRRTYSNLRGHHIGRETTPAPTPQELQKSVALVVAKLIVNSDWIYKLIVKAENTFFEDCLSLLPIYNLYVSYLWMDDFYGKKSWMKITLERRAQHMSCTVNDRFLVERVNAKLGDRPDIFRSYSREEVTIAQITWAKWVDTYEVQHPSVRLATRNLFHNLSASLSLTTVMCFGLRTPNPE